MNVVAFLGWLLLIVSFGVLFGLWVCVKHYTVADRIRRISEEMMEEVLDEQR